MSRTCIECHSPLPEYAGNGRPRMTCSGKCRKRASRKRLARQRQYATKSSTRYHPQVQVAEEVTEETSGWTPGLWETFCTVLECCKTPPHYGARFTSDTGDGTDVTEIMDLAGAWIAENPGNNLVWERIDRLTVDFWIPRVANNHYLVDYNPPPGMCQIYLDGESLCRMHAEKKLDGLNVCARHYGILAA